MFRYRNKYGNKKTEVDGITFDSKKEANRYLELKLMQKSGHIQDLELQPVFVLQEKFKHKGKSYRDIRYIADFRYKENGEVIVEDVKSAITKANAAYKLKKKMLLCKNPEINFKET